MAKGRWVKGGGKHREMPENAGRDTPKSETVSVISGR